MNKKSICMGEVWLLGLGANTMASAGARSYNEGLEAEPQQDPGAEPPEVRPL